MPTNEERIRQEIAGAVVRRTPELPRQPEPAPPDRSASQWRNYAIAISALIAKPNLTQWLLIAIVGLLAVIVAMVGLAWRKDTQRRAAEARFQQSIAEVTACIRSELDVASIRGEFGPMTRAMAELKCHPGEAQVAQNRRDAALLGMAMEEEKEKSTKKAMSLEEKKEACLTNAGTDEAKKTRCERQYALAKTKMEEMKAANKEE